MKTMMQLRHKVLRNDQRGFSLIELSCALMVISVGLFGALQLMHQSLNHSRALQEYQAAHHLLENTLETVRSQGYEHLEAGETPLDPALLEASGLHLAEGAVSVAPHDNALLWEITVRLRWVGDKGRIIERELNTLAGPLS